jgi:hypothetical protein
VLTEGQHSINIRKNKHFSIGRIFYGNRSKPREAQYSVKVIRKILQGLDVTDLKFRTGDLVPGCILKFLNEK